MLKLHFVTNCWPDITKKLQKTENWKDKNLEELREAQKVYVRWNEEKQKQNAKTMLSTIKQINQEKNTFQRVGLRPTQMRMFWKKEWREDIFPYSLW
jgi:hypothetical protein